MSARFAVVRRSHDPLPPETLASALRGVPGLTAYDLKSIGGDGHGIIGRGFSEAQAGVVRANLQSAGQAAEVIEETKIPVLTPGRVVQGMEFTAEALLVVDVLGRKQPVDWRQVNLIAAGSVNVTTFGRTRREWEEVRTNVIDAGLGGIPVQTRYTQFEYVSNESSDWALRAEIATAGDLRFAVEAEKFRFAALGDRMTKELATNFCLLIGELARRAPQATLNRGAQAVLSQPPAFVYYAQRTIFYEELAWLRWLAAQPGGQPS